MFGNLITHITITKGLNPNFDNKYSFVTFDEFVDIAKSKGAGIAPEIKIPNVINRVSKFNSRVKFNFPEFV